MAIAGETAAVEEIWDSSQFASKPHLLKVARESASRFFQLIEAPENWELPVSKHWEVRDLAAHMVDVIEGYLKAYETARRGEEAPTPFGTRVMGKRLYEQTQALRSVPREELLSRLTFFGRIRADTTYGDRELGDRFRGIVYST